MSKNGSIILVEDDPDDQEMIMRAIKLISITNSVKIFRDGEEALHYLKNMSEQPFTIRVNILSYWDVLRFPNMRKLPLVSPSWFQNHFL